MCGGRIPYRPAPRPPRSALQDAFETNNPINYETLGALARVANRSRMPPQGTGDARRDKAGHDAEVRNDAGHETQTAHEKVKEEKQGEDHGAKYNESNRDGKNDKSPGKGKIAEGKDNDDDDAPKSSS